MGSFGWASAAGAGDWGMAVSARSGFAIGVVAVDAHASVGRAWSHVRRRPDDPFVELSDSLPCWRSFFVRDEDDFAVRMGGIAVEVGSDTGRRLQVAIWTGGVSWGHASWLAIR